MAVLLIAAGLALVPACSKTSTCSAPAGGRCPGPLPISSVSVSHSGTKVYVDSLCGGRLTSKESRTTVTVTYVASSVGPGAMACACVPLEVDLASPIGTRTLVDGATGKRLSVDNSHPLCGAASIGS